MRAPLLQSGWFVCSRGRARAPSILPADERVYHREIATLHVIELFARGARKVMQTVEDAIAVIRGTDWEARSAAEAFLARSARFEQLLPYLTDDDWRVRLFVTRAIAQLPARSASVVAELQRRLDAEDDEWVRNNLRWAVRCHLSEIDPSPRGSVPPATARG